MAERLKGSGLSAADLSRWKLLQTLTTEHDGALMRGIGSGHKLRAYFVTGPRTTGRQDVPGIVEELRSLAPKGETTRLGAGVRAALDDLRGARLPPSSCLPTESTPTGRRLPTRPSTPGGAVYRSTSSASAATTRSAT